MHAMFQGQGDQVRIVHQVSCNAAFCKDPAQVGVMGFRFREDLHHRRMQETG